MQQSEGIDVQLSSVRRPIHSALLLVTMTSPAFVIAQQPASPAAPATSPPPASQNPSPMTEETRAHERLVPRELGGTRRTFSTPAAFYILLAAITRESSMALGHEPHVNRVTLVGFSAGHGAIRAILREPRHFARVDAVLLLDGMHTSYVPEGTPVAAGGSLDPHNLSAFVDFAQAAMRGEKHFVVSHSEIFPGTFASTTETADYLLHTLSLHRTPVLRWGPRDMQQLSEAIAGRFELLGFAGNSAPDHIDQLHAMPELLDRVSRP